MSASSRNTALRLRSAYLPVLPRVAAWVDMISLETSFRTDDRSARGLDGCARAGSDTQTTHRDATPDLSGAHDAGRLPERGDQSSLLEHDQIDFVRLQTIQVAQPNRDHKASRDRPEPALRKATVQRHLSAFEADLVKATGARLLTLVAAPRGLAPAAADAAADPVPGTARAVWRLHRIQSHGRRFCHRVLAHLHQVGHLVDHASHRGRVLQLARLVDPLQS